MHVPMRHQSIARALSAPAKFRLRRLLPTFIGRAAGRHDAQSIRQVATATLKVGFAGAREARLQVLATYLIGLAAAAELAKGGLDSLSEFGKAESLHMQMKMDRQSKFMTALSNIMKQSSDTGSAIVQNLK